MAIPTEKALAKALREVWHEPLLGADANKRWLKQARYVRKLLKETASDSYFKGKIS